MRGLFVVAAALSILACLGDASGSVCVMHESGRGSWWYAGLEWPAEQQRQRQPGEIRWLSQPASALRHDHGAALIRHNRTADASRGCPRGTAQVAQLVCSAATVQLLPVLPHAAHLGAHCVSVATTRTPAACTPTHMPTTPCPTNTVPVPTVSHSRPAGPWVAWEDVKLKP